MSCAGKLWQRAFSRRRRILRKSGFDLSDFLGCLFVKIWIWPVGQITGRVASSIDIAKARAANGCGLFLFKSFHPIGRRRLTSGRHTLPRASQTASSSEPLSPHHTIGRHARTCRLAARVVARARGPL